MQLSVVACFLVVGRELVCSKTPEMYMNCVMSNRIENCILRYTMTPCSFQKMEPHMFGYEMVSYIHLKT